MRLSDVPGTIPTPAPLLIDAKAARLAISMGERKLWSLTNCRAIPSRKIGKSVRYSPAELAAWVACGCPTDPGAGDRVRKEVAA
jgi:predicted DNA-binding transcriptional regulator AlpA